MEEGGGDPLPLCHCHREKIPVFVFHPHRHNSCRGYLSLTRFLSEYIPWTPSFCPSCNPHQWVTMISSALWEKLIEEETMMCYMECKDWLDDGRETVPLATLMAAFGMSNHAAAEPMADAAALSPKRQQNLQPMNLDLNLDFNTTSSKETNGPSPMRDEVAPMAPRPLPSCRSPSTAEHILHPEANRSLAEANDATSVAMTEQGNVLAGALHRVNVRKSKEQLLLRIQSLLAQKNEGQLHVLLNFLQIWNTVPKCVEDYCAQAQHSGALGSLVPRSNAQAQHSGSKQYPRRIWMHFRKVRTVTDSNVLARCLYCDKVFQSCSETGGTSHLRRHVLSRHKNYWDLQSCSQPPKTPQKIEIVENPISLSRKKESENENEHIELGNNNMGIQPGDMSRNHTNDMEVELNEVDHKDVKVETGDASRKRKKCASESESEAWLHFTKVLDDSGVIVKGKCKYCGKFLKAHPKTNGTSRLLRHVEDIHGIELKIRSPNKTKRRRVTPTIKAKVAQSSECCGLAPDKAPLPSHVIMLEDSGDTVGKISRLEEQLLHRINSTPEQEVLVQISDAKIKKKELESLADSELEDGPSRYLVDDIIDAYIYILKDKIKDDTRAHGRVYIETTVGCQQLSHRLALSIRTKKNRGIKYLKHDMIFLPINQNHNHWYLAVINTKKQEVQVLDSKEQFQERKELKLLLKNIEQCLEVASNEVQSNSWPDYKLTSWKVKEESQIPKQIDMSSCGLYVIKYMEYWTGENIGKTFTQADIDLFRLKLAAELMSSPLNKAPWRDPSARRRRRRGSQS